MCVLLREMKEILNDKSKLLISSNMEIEDLIWSSPDCDNRSVRFDVISSLYLGRVILWDSGDINVELLDIDTIKTIKSENSKVTCKKEIVDVVNQVLLRMKNSQV